jgi:hypothetical protein
MEADGWTCAYCISFTFYLYACADSVAVELASKNKELNQKSISSSSSSSGRKV